MYDIIIVGAGVSGIFTAYALLNVNKKIKILMIDKGNYLPNRKCPIEERQIKNCQKCYKCNKFIGFGGMGRSEGKYNYTNDFGGDLGKWIGHEEALRLMEEVDTILCSFGGSQAPYYDTENAILKDQVKERGFKALSTKVRHLGSKLSIEILQKMYDYLEDKVDICLSTEIQSIEKEEDLFDIKCDKTHYKSEKIIFATGLSGGSWFQNQCKNLGIIAKKSRVDLGFRLELMGNQLDSLLKNHFEMKLYYRGKDFEATTYCMNPRGRVIRKFQEGLVLADGQNYLEENQPSRNMNFTLFIPRFFPSMQEAKSYVKELIGGINQNQGRILVQRLEDIIKKRTTTKEGLQKNKIIPTLKATAGNIYDEIPDFYIKGTLNFLERLDDLLTIKINPDTLFYGMDVKFYEPEMEVNIYFETKVEGLYLVGDCSGVTYSLAQAAASGLYLGKRLGKILSSNS